MARIHVWVRTMHIQTLACLPQHLMCAFFQISDAPAKKMIFKTTYFFNQKPSYILNTTITLLSYHYHIIVISFSYHYHIIIISLSYHYHIISLSYHYYIIIISLSYHYHIIIILLSYHYHIIIISLPYHYHIIIISLSYLMCAFSCWKKYIISLTQVI